ncbi:MAG: PKD domain-containing protein [bacterium]|nr:PKD domain-containing protein [bacterium]
MSARSIISAIFLSVAASNPLALPATTWYVDGSVSASGGGKTWATAFKKIQEGIDVSLFGDTVMVARGTYGENVHFKGKNMTLTSTDPADPDVVDNTIIDGGRRGCVVAFAGTESPVCALSGLLIQNGSEGDYGEDRLAPRPSAIIEVAFEDTATADNVAPRDESSIQLVTTANAGGSSEYSTPADCPFTVGEGTSGAELTAFQNAHSLAGGSSELGCPTAVVNTSGFTSFKGTVAHYQPFDKGAIEYHTNGDYSGKAFAVVNPMYQKWSSIGFNRSNPLGYPTGHLSTAQVSSHGTQYKYQVFEGGSLEWHLTGGRAGKVYEVHGAIYTKWALKGYAASALGLPMGAEPPLPLDERDCLPSQVTKKQGRVSDFEGGHIHWWSDAPEAFETHGAIDSVYVNMGGTNSPAGFPISDEYMMGGHARSDFEGGCITTTNGVDYQFCPYVAADFSGSPRSGAVSLTVFFQDLSTGGNVNKWSWDFGDGGTSTLKNPSHLYTNNETTGKYYRVKLTAWNECNDTDTETKTDYIWVDPCPVVNADFSGSPRTGVLSASVNFQDLSTGGNINKWSWDFGDGGTSTQKNPSHTYTNNGTTRRYYTVNLTAWNDCNNADTETKTDYIWVDPPAPDISVTASYFPASVVLGQECLVEALVKNESSSVDAKGVTVQLRESGTILDSKGPFDLVKGQSRSERLYWKTSGVPTTAHNLNVYAPPLPGEGNLANNEYKFDITVRQASEAGTLLLTAWGRFSTVCGYSSADVSILRASAAKLSVLSWVNGVTFDVTEDTAVNSAFQAWDDHPLSASLAQQVVRNMALFLKNKKNSYANIEYLVVIGDDRVIPFDRIPDPTATLWDADEEAYTLVVSSTRTGAALRSNHVLTDDTLVSLGRKVQSHDKLFDVPALAAGRLVESPTRICALLDDARSKGHVVSPGSIVVAGRAANSAGEDFVWDATDNVSDAFRDRGLTVQELNWNEAPWYEADLEALIFQGTPDVVALLAHADHTHWGVAGGSIRASEVNASTTLGGTIFYSLGCHCGLNVSPDEPTNQLDIPEAMVTAKVFAYIGNTGYGIGTHPGVGYSERLLDILSQGIAQGQSVGSALRSAKEQYVLGSIGHGMSGYDEKAIRELTLYGLPLVRLNVPGGVATAPVGEETTAETPDIVVSSEEVESPIGSLVVLNIAVTVPAQAAISLPSGEVIFGFAGCGYQVNADSPVLSRLAVNTSTAGLNTHGTSLASAQYSFETPQDSVAIAAAVTSVGSTSGVFSSSKWYPSIFYSANVLVEEGQTGFPATLVSLCSQYRQKDNKVRLFSKVEYEVYCSDSDDYADPIIASVYSEEDEVVGGRYDVWIAATDDQTGGSGIYSVCVYYSEDQWDSWQRLKGTYDDGQGQWVVSSLGPFANASAAQYYVEVVDGAGNVRTDNNSGECYRIVPSVFQIEEIEQRAGGTVVIRWRSMVGEKYVVERCTRLVGDSWIPLSQQLESSGTVTEWEDPRGATAGSCCFYRIRKMQP